MPPKPLFETLAESDLVRRARLPAEDILKEVKFRALFKHEVLYGTRCLFDENDFIFFKCPDPAIPSSSSSSSSTANSTNPGFWGRIAASVKHPFRELWLTWKDLRLLMAARGEVRRVKEEMATNRHIQEYYIYSISEHEDPDKLVWTCKKIDPLLSQQHPGYGSYQGYQPKEPRSKQDRELIGHL